MRFLRIRNRRSSRPRARRRALRRSPIAAELLEDRQLLAGVLGLDGGLLLQQAAGEIGTSTGSLEKADDPEPPGEGGPQVPIWHSNFGAPHTIYLDFNGDTTIFDAWPPVLEAAHEDFIAQTPAFNLDGDANSFTQAELDAIEEIFQRVAEDFRPFNVNVTTALSQYDTQSASHVRVAIGGTSPFKVEMGSLRRVR